MPAVGMPDGRVIWYLMPALGVLSPEGRGSGAFRSPLPAGRVGRLAKSEADLMHYERAVVHLKPSAYGPVTFSLNVSWETGESGIRPENDLEIKKMAEIMRLYPQVTAEIKGYSDDRGPVEAKERLSEKRAEAVRRAAHSALGMDPHGVIAQKYSASRPMASDPTAEDRRIDRRIETVLNAPAQPLANASEFDTNP